MPALAVLTSYTDALAEEEKLQIYEDITAFKQEWDQYLRSDSSTQTIAGFMSSKALGATLKASENVSLC